MALWDQIQKADAAKAKAKVASMKKERGASASVLPAAEVGKVKGVVQYVPVTLSLPSGLIKRLDDWAHGERLTRSAAARKLLERGLG